MRRWSLRLALASGCFSILALGVSAQPGQPVPEPQALPIQVQIQPVQIQAVAVAEVPVPVLRAAQPGILPGGYLSPQRMLQADAIVVGRVIGLEPMDVEATPAAGQANKVNYRVAVVQISDVVAGVKKDSKMVRIGFLAPPANAPNPGGIQIQPLPAIQPVPPAGFRPRVPIYNSINLQVGQDGLFLLNKHHKENFYLVSNPSNFIPSQNNTNFENEVRNARQLGQVLDSPVAALKGQDRDQRYLAAAVLVTKYRSNPTGQSTKQVPIDSEESKLILKAMAEGNWTGGRSSNFVPTAMELFYMLNVGPADGYNPVNVRVPQEAMQKWINENSEKYVIKKLVVDPNAPVQPPVLTDPPEIQPLPIRPVRPPIKLKPGKVQPLPGKVQPLPAPVPLPQVQPGIIQPAPAVDAVPVPAVPVPDRR